MNNLDFHTILYYYAMFCLAFSPFSILLFVILYRKTKAFEWLNKAIDRMLGEAPKDDKKDGDAKNAAAESAVKPERSHIATFNLHVGDEYFCRSSYQYTENMLRDVEWSMDNEFLGEFDDNGKFKANKRGIINIYVTSKDNGFGNPDLAYSINILPSDPKWIGDRLIDAVTARMRREGVYAMNIKRKILGEKPASGIVEYASKERVPQTVLQFDSDGFLERGLYQFRYSEALMDTIESALEERFERLQVDQPGVQIWIHKIIDATKDEIDTYCYIRRMRNGNVAFCVGNTWREYGVTEEFIMNVKMAARIFEECLPGEPVPDIVIRKGAKTPAKKADTPKDAPAPEGEKQAIYNAIKGEHDPEIENLPMEEKEEATGEEQPEEEQLPTEKDAAALMAVEKEFPQETADGSVQEPESEHESEPVGENNEEEPEESGDENGEVDFDINDIPDMDS